MLGVLTKYSGVVYQLERGGAPTESVLLVAHRMRDGLTELDLRSIVAYCGHASGQGWADKPEMRPYLRPATLFGPKTHAKYLDPARSWHRQYFGQEAS